MRMCCLIEPAFALAHGEYAHALLYNAAHQSYAIIEDIKFR